MKEELLICCQCSTEFLWRHPLPRRVCVTCGLKNLAHNTEVMLEEELANPTASESDKIEARKTAEFFRGLVGY